MIMYHCQSLTCFGGPPITSRRAPVLYKNFTPCSRQGRPCPVCSTYSCIPSQLDHAEALSRIDDICSKTGSAGWSPSLFTQSIASSSHVVLSLVAHNVDSAYGDANGQGRSEKLALQSQEMYGEVYCLCRGDSCSHPKLQPVQATQGQDPPAGVPSVDRSRTRDQIQRYNHQHQCHQESQQQSSCERQQHDQPQQLQQQQQAVHAGIAQHIDRHHHQQQQPHHHHDCHQSVQGTGHAVKGFACMLVVAGEAQLENMAVLPEHQGKGLGRLLLSTLLETCHCHVKQGGCPCLLEVQANNQAAITLYTSMGFQIEGKRKGYYENGIDALLMLRQPGILVPR